MYANKVMGTVIGMDEVRDEQSLANIMSSCDHFKDYVKI